jgi:hypothetical protein
VASRTLSARDLSHELRSVTVFGQFSVEATADRRPAARRTEKRTSEAATYLPGTVAAVTLPFAKLECNPDGYGQVRNQVALVVTRIGLSL